MITPKITINKIIKAIIEIQNPTFIEENVGRIIPVSNPAILKPIDFLLLLFFLAPFNHHLVQ